MFLYKVLKIRLLQMGKGDLLGLIAKISFLSWIFSIIAVALIIAYVVGVRKELFNETPEIFTYIILGFVAFGILSFIIGTISFSTKLLSSDLEKKPSRHKKAMLIFKVFFSFFVFPLFLINRVIEPLKIFEKFRKRDIKEFKNFSPKLIFVRSLALIGIFIVILPIWTGGYLTVWYIAGSKLGYISQEMSIVGTGSMYPTWEKGTKGKSDIELTKEIVSTAGFLPYPNGLVIGGERYFGHTLGRGDIITWINDATKKLTSEGGAEPAGLLKRLIGLPGDKIELRDGIVYINGKPQKEPYIAKPHSTYGERFLRECQEITVPRDSVFAMGDNRKGSADSREIGFVPIKDIDLVIPFIDQKGKLDKNWHDTTNDLNSSSKPKIDRNKFLKLLNLLRKENGASELKYNFLLEKSAEFRGREILKNNDFDQRQYTMEQSMADAGYWNSFWWEVPIEGYYEADELIEDYLERDSSEAKNTWFDKRFDDIGIAEVYGELNNCPTQVIVIQVAGYIPATYKQEVIDSWKKALAQLREVFPSWEKIKEYSLTYNNNRKDADRLLEIINYRITMMQKIVNKMDNRQWLNSEENAYMNSGDEALSNEAQIISKKLNSIRWQL